jgi:hypothetical protein
MTELRHLLGLLTPDPSEAGQASGGIRPAAGVASPGDVPGEPGQATASGTPSPADRVAPPSEGVSAGQTTLHPQPGLAQLGSLLAGVEAAGLPVEFSANGRHRDLPPGVDLAAYRVMQEALTNVIKHAGRARTHARLDYQPAELIIEIANDAPPPGGDPAAEPGTGRGLIGMRERAALYGGTLDAGPRPGGGWRVRAKIPTRSGPCAARAVPTAAGLDGAAT